VVLEDRDYTQMTSHSGVLYGCWVHYFTAFERVI
jgi:hypothetical protein